MGLNSVPLLNAITEIQTIVYQLHDTLFTKTICPNLYIDRNGALYANRNTMTAIQPFGQSIQMQDEPFGSLDKHGKHFSCPISTTLRCYPREKAGHQQMYPRLPEKHNTCLTVPV
ncbi:hypothetical protein DERF_001627 [Dermatophagoides farinae]|uniref:Uncharacterized protein n=1 Tax=Dermatophagoides farinae TaxID=6954 RepID=A0A922LD19_DERFA|nr:hypothetical protein DERF_001627 [Dermatophagoides farinae]